MNPKVDEFIYNAENRRDEMQKLRLIILECGLKEEFKWRQPCYTYQGKNIIIISNFKEYCALGFFKGALLSDAEGILHSPGDNSQSSRMIKFSDLRDIFEKEAIIKAYIFEAVEAEKSGLKVKFKKIEAYEIPEELEVKFNESSALKTAFNSLTPGRQKAYILHFSGAKQSQTRTARIEKYIPRILTGKGINDCICGHSKRMPQCDGSHKHIS